MNYSLILKVDLEKSSGIVFLQIVALIIIISMLIDIFNKPTPLKNKISILCTNILLRVLDSLLNTGTFVTLTQRSTVGSINPRNKI